MAENARTHTAPYATFTTFLNFFNKLQETAIPSRIDPSVFGNASGSISYSVIAALKSLKLIDAEGIPSAEFRQFVNASEDDRKPMMAAFLRRGYPSLWNGSIDLATVSAGQFDEHLRQEYDVKGSTVDKAAAFFIAAAKFAEMPISPHLKARKPVASSTSSKKSARQRRAKPEDGAENDFTPPPPAQEQKALEYQLIDLMTEPDIEDDIKASIWNLVQYLTARKAKNQDSA